jgi:Putative adhesin
MKNIFLAIFTLCVVSVALAQDGDFHLDNVYKIDKKGTIDLSSSDAKVFITGSLRPDVHVKIDRRVETKGFYNSREEFTVEVESIAGDLRIRERQNSSTSGIITYHKEDYKIEIEAPEGVTLSIRGDDGDYFIKNVNGSISMSIDDADAQLTACKGNKFTFRIDDGDIRMDEGRGSLEVDSDDADVTIYKGQFSSINANSDDGDIVIQTSLADNGQYSFKCQDGLVSLDVTGGGGEFTVHHDDGHISSSGEFRTTYETEDQTRLRLDRGTAKVTVRADDARVRLGTN